MGETGDKEVKGEGKEEEEMGWGVAYRGMGGVTKEESGVRGGGRTGKRKVEGEGSTFHSVVLFV